MVLLVTTDNTTLTDTRVAWTVNMWAGYVVTCNGKTMTVVSNTATAMTGATWSGGGNPGNGFAWSMSGSFVVPVYTLSGRVVITSLFCTCTTGLSGATATLSFGTATTPAGLIAATTATSIVATRLWIDTGPDASVFGVHIGASAFAGDIVTTESLILTVAVADITGGVLVFNCTYEPLTDGGSLT